MPLESPAAKRQLDLLRALLARLRHSNRFYAPRLTSAGLDETVPDFETFCARCPRTTKDELVADQAAHPPFGTNLTAPITAYVRFHQTSGTTGAPLRWLDTEEGWSWIVGNWAAVLAAAGVTASDRLFLPFSFGPFLGFWGAFDAATRMGCLTIPGGGLDTLGRLRVMRDNAVTAVCCTPTYAIRLGEVARSEMGPGPWSGVRTLIVAGEPGGSVPATRARIETLWPGAAVFDHHGMTEVGPVSVPNAAFPGILHVLADAYWAEILDPATGEAVPRGETGELVLTTLGRADSPLLRYRTGDLVCASTRDPAELGRDDLALEGGILARVDDMVVVRGVNLYPSAVEQVVRATVGSAEYRVTLVEQDGMTEVSMQVEGDDATASRLARALRDALHLRIPVRAVAVESLPRFELKAKRWLRPQHSSPA